MNIDVSDLMRKKHSKKALTTYFHEEDIFCGEDIRLIGPVKLDLTLSILENIISVDGDITAEAYITCSRCLEQFKYPINIEFHEKFSKDAYEEEGIEPFQAEEIDIKPLVENAIVMSLPIKKLCNDNCKGICPTCGKVLNSNGCSCGVSFEDPRLSKLKDFFSDK